MTLRAGVVGGASWNTMVFVERFPEPHPQTLFARDMHRTLGSSGAGKAMNFRSLGAEAVLWALVGDDDEGERVRQRLGSAGVEFHAHPDPAVAILPGFARFSLMTSSPLSLVAGKT